MDVKIFLQDILESARCYEFSKQRFSRSDIMEGQVSRKKIIVEIEKLIILCQLTNNERAQLSSEVIEIWRRVVMIDKEWRFGIFNKYRGNKIARMRISEFLHPETANRQFIHTSLFDK